MFFDISFQASSDWVVDLVRMLQRVPRYAEAVEQIQKSLFTHQDYILTISNIILTKPPLFCEQRFANLDNANAKYQSRSREH